MRLRTIATMTACIALLTSASQVLARQKGGKGGKGGQMRHQFREEMKAHHQQQMKENKAFRETLKDQTPQEACTALKAHLAKQFTENKAFRDQIHTKLVAAITARGEEKDGGAERVKEMLAKMEERRTAARAKIEEAQAKALKKLDELSQKEDLTWKELHEVMKAAREQHRERRQNRQEQRRERRGNRDKNKPAVEI